MTDPLLLRIDNLVQFISSLTATNKQSVRSEEELYDHIEDKSCRQQLADHFEPNRNLWTTTFANAVKMAKAKSGHGLNVRAKFHGLRILIQKQTLHAIENNYYITSNGTTVPLDGTQILQTAKQTKFYTSSAIKDIPTKHQQQPHSQRQPMHVDVLNIDCLDAAYSLLRDGYNPCVLNMANAKTPGGGWQSGAGAQEENIARRSTLMTSLCNHTHNLLNYPRNKQGILDKRRAWNYPLQEFGGIYSPNVIIFRGNEADGYDFLEKPYSVSVITAAMYKEQRKSPNYDTETLEYKAQHRPKVIEKLKSVLRMAYDNGHDSVVLSAWGCGAFRNPPNAQASLWKSVLYEEKEFQGRFKRIVFAIFDDHNTGDTHNPFGNVLPFINAFGITQKRIHELAEIVKGKESKHKPMIGVKIVNDRQVVDELKIIFGNISDEEKSRDLDFGVVHRKLASISCALQILYCGGFKRSSDGSRLQLEGKRKPIAQRVFEQISNL